MTTSGVYNFDPSLGNIVIGAFSRCGIRRTEITSQHMQDAYFEANMLQSELQGDGIQTWQVTLEKQDIIAGKSIYDVNPYAIFVLDLYVRQYGANSSSVISNESVGWTNQNSVISNWANDNNFLTPWTGTISPAQSTAIDRILLPFSRTDYASIANKYQSGFPTSFWFDRVIPPKLYLWPVPQADIPQGLQYYIQRRPEIAELGNGSTVDMPYEVYDYWTWSLAERLAFLYAPEKLPLIAPRKQAAYLKYTQATTENVPLQMNIQMMGYYR